MQNMYVRFGIITSIPFQFSRIKYGSDMVGRSAKEKMFQILIIIVIYDCVHLHFVQIKWAEYSF
jgi:hypothetical protein